MSLAENNFRKSVNSWRLWAQENVFPDMPSEYAEEASYFLDDLIELDIPSGITVHESPFISYVTSNFKFSRGTPHPGGQFVALYLSLDDGDPLGVQVRYRDGFHSERRDLVDDIAVAEVMSTLEEALNQLVEQPRDNPGAAAPAATRSSKKADDIFRTWHAKEPRRRTNRKVRLLDENRMVCIGKGVEITYSSDKWEKDGDFYPYVHGHDSLPGVYVPDSQAGEDERIGRPAKTLSLLGLRAKPKRLDVAQLGTVDELIIENAKGNVVKLPIGSNSKLLSTPDKRGLIILSPKGPIIVRGGQMKVTHRGIVK